MLKLYVLASGSRGNATVVQNLATGRAVLVDCGITKKAFLERCQLAGIDPCCLDAVVITHDHGDHVNGLGVVMRGLAKLGCAPAVYVDPAVRAASRKVAELEGSFDLRPLACGDALSLAGMQVHPFATSHDAAASCGFRFEADGDAAGYMTDSGVVTGAAHEALGNVRLLALESNHDPLMLDQGPYPYVVKRRIGSEVGHLSNEQAAEELGSLLSPALQQVAAMHVSQNNNEYRLPRTAFTQVMERECHPATVQVAFQDKPIVLA